MAPCPRLQCPVRSSRFSPVLAQRERSRGRVPRGLRSCSSRVDGQAPDGSNGFNDEDDQELAKANDGNIMEHGSHTKLTKNCVLDFGESGVFVSVHTWRASLEDQVRWHLRTPVAQGVSERIPWRQDQGLVHKDPLNPLGHFGNIFELMGDYPCHLERGTWALLRMTSGNACSAHAGAFDSFYLHWMDWKPSFVY